MIHAVYYCTSREDVSGLMRLANCKQQLDTVLYTFTLYHVGWMFDPKNFEISKPNTAQQSIMAVVPTPDRGALIV